MNQHPADNAAGSLSCKELFARACHGLPVPRVPVWIMRQAGRYLPEYRAIRAKHSFLEVCKTPELAIEVSLQPLRRLGVDAAIVFSDILIPAEAMGLPLEVGDAGPLLPQPVRDLRAVDALREFDPEVETRPLMDAIRGLTREVGPDLPVLGFAAAPWTLACYLVEGRTKHGFTEPKRMLCSEPHTLRLLLEKIARLTARYLRAQIAAGAAAVQLFDTWAGELTLEQYEAFALPAAQQLLAELRAGSAHRTPADHESTAELRPHAAATPVIYYSKATRHLLRALPRIGADVLSVDWRIDLAEARRRFGPRPSLQGNVDPCVLLSTPAVVAGAARTAIDKTAGVGHILNLGHGILPDTPVDHAQEFVRAAKNIPLPVAVSAAENK